MIKTSYIYNRLETKRRLYISLNYITSEVIFMTKSNILTILFDRDNYNKLDSEEQKIKFIQIVLNKIETNKKLIDTYTKKIWKALKNS